ncbi:MAG: two-component regulator propeller domain-containing protein [Chitinophagaceae bacterium]
MKIKSGGQYNFILCWTFLIAVTTSCTSQSQSNNDIRLQYTTGVRSILEDSKGNIWFGSYNEGVCLLHNGELQYFTTENGLSNNQVRSIYEDKNGIIWYVCGRGLSTYDGKEITIYTERNYNAKNDWKINESDFGLKAMKLVATIN